MNASHNVSLMIPFIYYKLKYTFGMLIIKFTSCFKVASPQKKFLKKVKTIHLLQAVKRNYLK